MSEIVYLSEEEDRIFIDGPITFKNVVKIRAKGLELINSLVEVKVDFIKVPQADSSALSLIASWARDVKEQYKAIKYYNLPRKLLELGRFNDLESVLPVFSEDGAVHYTNVGNELV